MDVQVCGWGVGSRVISATKKATSLVYFKVVVAEHCQISPLWRDGKGVDANKTFGIELGSQICFARRVPFKIQAPLTR